MASKDLLLSLTSYPEPTAVSAAEAAIGYAALLDARITAVAFEIEIPMPLGFYADALVDLSGLIAAEREKSVRHARALVSAFEAAARRWGVPHEALVGAANTAQTPALIRDHARLRDLTILPLGPTPDYRHVVAETVIFEAGRPVLVLPEAAALTPALDRVVVAWDFGRPAARALADALPLLARAGHVAVVNVETGTPPETTRTREDLLRHLDRHGIAATFETFEAGDRTVGAALADHAVDAGADLLVMGAYGHSRLRDFVVGGATKSLLAAPPLPLFLSH
jgi:nucleotide-binding universal stress UspA family protein